MPVSQAKVKQILSGDTLVLVSLNNPSQERTLSLAFVSAPRLRREGDEVSRSVSRSKALQHIDGQRHPYSYYGDMVVAPDSKPSDPESMLFFPYTKADPDNCTYSHTPFTQETLSDV